MLRRNVSIHSTIVLLAISACLGILIYLMFYGRSHPVYFSGPVEHITTGNVGEYSALSIIAQQQGYFAQYGVEVKMVEYPTGPDAVDDMLANKIDMATAANFVAVSNSFSNKDLRILATQLQADSFFMAARQDHDVHTPSDLKGKKIGVTAKTAGEFYLGDFLILNGLGLSDVQLVFDTPVNLVDQLVSNKLDAIVSFDPHIYRVQQQLGDKTLVWQVQSGERLSALLLGSNRLIKTKPEAIKRYLRALAAAETFGNAHNQTAKEIVARYLDYETDYTNRIWQRIGFNLSLSQDLLITMTNQARWALENDVVSASEVPDFLNVLYFDGMEAAKPDGITIIR